MFHSHRIVVFCILAATIALFVLCKSPPLYSSPTQELRGCARNLLKLSIALDEWGKYHSESSGEPFPYSLKRLTPYYLSDIPVCPTSGTDTYTAGYSGPLRDGGGYLLVCKGASHARCTGREDYPRYVCYLGLISGDDWVVSNRNAEDFMKKSLWN